jgi:hypothetical protein
MHCVELNNTDRPANIIPGKWPESEYLKRRVINLHGRSVESALQCTYSDAGSKQTRCRNRLTRARARSLATRRYGRARAQLCEEGPLVRHRVWLLRRATPEPGSADVGRDLRRVCAVAAPTARCKQPRRSRRVRHSMPCHMDTMPLGIPCRAGYHAARDTMPLGMRCRRELVITPCFVLWSMCAHPLCVHPMSVVRSARINAWPPRTAVSQAQDCSCRQA